MDNKNIKDNILTIEGNSDNLFNKVVFVLKPETQEDINSIDFTKEADKILNNYMLNAVYEIQSKGSINKNSLNENRNINKYKSVEPNSKPQQKNHSYNNSYTPHQSTNNFIDRFLTFSILLCSVVIFVLLYYM